MKQSKSIKNGVNNKQILDSDSDIRSQSSWSSASDSFDADDLLRSQKESDEEENVTMDENVLDNEELQKSIKEKK